MSAWEAVEQAQPAVEQAQPAVEQAHAAVEQAQAAVGRTSEGGPRPTILAIPGLNDMNASQKKPTQATAVSVPKMLASKLTSSRVIRKYAAITSM